MKLSVYILVDWLKEYKLSIHITDGRTVLTGARLFSGDPFSDDSFLYIGRAAEIYPDQFQEDQVLCTNGKDRILIDTTDRDRVLNEILRAFDTYNAWEATLKEAAYSNKSYQYLVDLAYPIFKNPIFMVDWYGKVLAMTSQDEATMDGATWGYMRTHGYLPVYIYDRVKISSEQFRAIEKNKEIFYLDIPLFDYHCIHCTVFVDNQPVLNFEISKNETELTEGMRHLAETFRQAVIIKLQLSNTSTAMPPAQALFSEILSGKTFDSEALYRVLFSLGWENAKSWYLVTFLNPFSGNMSAMVLLQQLGRSLPCSVNFEWENQPILLIDCKDWAANLPMLKKLLNDGSYSAGVSMPLRDLKDLPIGFMQAKVALSYSTRESVISLCADFAWGYLLSEFSRLIKDEKMLHPSFETLEEYDKKNSSELSKTLYAYLYNERSMVVTADKLFIHRNTLRYRLEQIGELINVDLDDPGVRTYLLFSYLVKDQQQKVE